MNIRLSAICRKNGKAYYQLENANSVSLSSLKLSAKTNNGYDVPVQFDAERGVVALPLVNASSWKLTAVNSQSGESCTKSLNCFSAKWKSRLNYRLKASECASISEGISMLNEVQSDLYCSDVIPAGDNRIVRIHAQIPAVVNSLPSFEFLSAEGASQGLIVDKAKVESSGGGNCETKLFPYEAFFLEDGTHFAESNNQLLIREITISLKLPNSVSSFGVKCVDETNQVNPGFVWVDESSLHAIMSATQNRMASAEHDPGYNQWWNSHRATAAELAKQKETTFAYMPLVSIVVPLYKTPKVFLREMIDSVLNQSYQNWELVLANASPESKDIKEVLTGVSDARIKEIVLEDNQGISVNTNAAIDQAKGEYVAFFDHDDLLAPDALYSYVEAINKTKDATDELPVLLYCDEDKIDGKGVHSNPFFKPNYSPDLLRAHNYITHFLVVKHSVLQEVGVLNPEYDGAQDYDLTLRVCEKAKSANQIVHIQRVLYHWRLHAQSTSMNSDSKDYAKTAGIRAVQAHVERMGFNAEVGTIENLPFAYRVKYVAPEVGVAETDAPLVSIIIPNKDHVDLLSACVESILNKCTYQNYEIVIVENNSTNAETFDYYENIKAKDSRIKVVVWTPAENEPAFNFSKIVNCGVAHAVGEYVLLLNNDTEVISPDFIETMLGYFQDENVGVVGAKLLYKDRTVQHGGVVIGPYNQASHLFMSMPEDELGYYCRAVLPQNLSAVTGACQLIRREVYLEVGGYTEEFSVAFNDVDFCLKVRDLGYRITFTPFAKLYHFEFASRGRDVDDTRAARVNQETQLLHERWPQYFENGDPFTSPFISRDSLYFGLNLDRC